MASSYGRDTYGSGRYGMPDTLPVVTPIAPAAPTRAAARAQHFLGIGPWSDSIFWRGAPNYGIAAGARSAVPVMAMPTAQSVSMTLRLNQGGEARADYDMNVQDALVIQEMATDLWWRRRDPRNASGEMLGRFIADNVDVASAEFGRVRLSVTWVDYQSLLEDRVVMRYADIPTADQSTWPAGAQVADILEFIIPNNSGIDITTIGAAALGTIRDPYELPPGTTVEEALNNLRNLSAATWEWWVEQPTDHGARPVIQFTPGERGSNNGVVLMGPTTGGSIESWTMQAAGARYANTLYFTGGDEGPVYTLLDEVALFGQRDATESDASVAANTKQTDAAAIKRLNELADRRPTWNLRLRPGFWQGRNHIDIGDTVTVRIALGADLLTSQHRVSELTVELDADNNEDVSLTLGTPRPSSDPRSRQSALARLVRRLKNYERKVDTV